MSRPKSIEIGDVVAGKYRLLAMIGEGGMGVVYLAEHTLIEKRMALKVLRAEYSGKPELVSRFQQEAISASRIKHPNVLDVFDFGQLEDGSFFLAMEYLTGRDLAAELTENGTVEPSRAVRVSLQMCRALASAHSRGVVHRDLKPENVFLHVTEEGDEIVKIVDFGIAQLRGKEEQEETHQHRRRLTRAGMIFGTPEYMSPEQCKGGSVDLRSDIYALGVILYEMLSGAVPFTGTTFMAVLTAHLTQPIPPIRALAPDLEISSELEQAVMRSLSKDPDKRFQSMRELAAALQLAEEGRVASPLGGLLPLPEVNIGSFRPARGPATVTAPQIERQDPAPFDLVSRDAASRESSNTLINGSREAAALPVEQLPGGFSVTKRTRVWPKMALYGVALLVGATATVGWKFYGVRLRQFLAGTTPAPSVSEANPAPPSRDRLRAAAPSAVAAGAQPNPEDAVDGGSAAAPNNEPSKNVVLTVQSNLPGAIVTKDGFQVCDQTPCTVEVPRGAAVELVGTKGYARGVARVLAQQDQTVNIVLTYAKSGGKKPESSKPGLCEVTVDGLKILRPCE